jgi:galactan endo-1,6-beta-galactosidase
MTRRLLLLLLTGAASLRAEAATGTLELDPAASQGSWDGWGASLCWWAAVFGDREDLADALFTTREVTLAGGRLPGLGLTIARYNAGACGWRRIGGREMQRSKIILRYRQMEGFWLDDRSADPESPSWDWSVDAKQRAMLQKAKARGVDRFELFSNSPMWWMTRNDNPSGGPRPTDDNLAPEHERNFAIYLATIARRAKDHWGIGFTTVSPFNEPVSEWWHADCKQEGCHVSPAQQARVLPLLREELDRRGLQDLPIAASEETYYDHAVATWRHFDEKTRALIGQVNVHGYQEAQGRRDELHRLVREVAGKPLWNSEYGDGEPTGLNMARNLHRDFHWLKPTSWSYWQPVDGGGWGLISADLPRARLGRVNPKWHVLAHYTRHLRPGFRILTTGDESVVAAQDPVRGRLVVVCLNDGREARQWRIGLARFGGGAEPRVSGWITRPRGTERHAVMDGLALRDGALALDLPPGSVVTAVVETDARDR